MNKTIQIIAFIFCIYVFNLSAQDKTDFTPKQKKIIYTKALEVINNYAININQTGNVENSIDEAKDYGENLIDLFVNRKVMVYNDLDPAHQLSEFYEVESYTANLILWYPDGIKVEMLYDSAKVSKINRHGKEVFSVDIFVPKKINGNYLNKTMNEQIEDITFRVAFSNKNNNIDQFKIAGIRQTQSTTIVDDSRAMNEVQGKDFSDEEFLKLQDFLKTTLGDYNNYLSLISNPEEPDDEKIFYVAAFVELFKDSTSKVFNDLETEPEETYLDASDYIAKFREWYPGGVRNIALNLDSVEYGKPVPEKKSTYSIYVYADKYFSGKYKKKSSHRFQANLSVKICFEKTANSYTNLKIESVDKTGIDYFGGADGGQLEIPSLTIKPLGKKGWYAGVFASYGYSTVVNPLIEQQSIEENYHEWNVNGDFSYNIGVRFNYYFNDFLGLETGFGTGRYTSKYNLNSYSRPDSVFTNGVTNYLEAADADYYEVVEAQYDSIVELNMINIPVLLKFSNAKPGKFGFYAAMGVNLLLNYDNKAKVSGHYATKGLFTSLTINDEYYEIRPEFDPFGRTVFYNRSNINQERDLDFKALNVLYVLNLGVSIPLSYYSSIELGPNFIFGNITENDKPDYFNIFDEKFSYKPVKLRNYSLEVSYRYKF